MLNPEDSDITEEELTDITIKNILTDRIYNDLGFSVRNRSIILVDAQSSWSVNIIVRALMYLVETFNEYFERTRQNVYSTVKLNIPMPEMYVVYTGIRGNKPDVLSFSEIFFDGNEVGLEVRVNVIYGDDTGGIINQYIDFTRAYDEQRMIYGRAQEAVTEITRICKDRDILNSSYAWLR